MTPSIKIFAETKEQVDLLYEQLDTTVHFTEASSTFNKTQDINGITLYYNDDLYVGSDHLVEHFVDILKHFYPNKKFNNTLDWCCGAGFLGFTIFSHDLTDKLVLLDKYKPALNACNKTISEMNAENITTTDCFTNEKFDLVIANPPWFLINNMLSLYNDRARKTTDIGGKTHKEFFSKIKNYLADDGIIILVEGSMSSSPLCFKDMIEDNGLVITKVLSVGDQPSYYMIIEAV